MGFALIKDMQVFRDDTSQRSNAPEPTVIESSAQAEVVSMLPLPVPTYKRFGLFRLLWSLGPRILRYRNILQGLSVWFRDLGQDALRVQFLGFDLEVTQDPNRAHQVLVKDWLNHPKTAWEHKVLSPLMNGGLIVLQGEQWHAHRMLMAELFSPTVIQELGKTVSDFTRTRMKHWDEKKEVDLAHEAQCVMIPCLLQTLFESAPSTIDQFSRHLSSIEGSLEARVFNPFLRMNPEFSKKSEAGQAVDKLTQIIHPSQAQSDGISRCPYHRMLKLFRSKGRSSKEMVNEGLTLFGAGATTVHLLSWCGYLLGSHPEVQEKLHQELVPFFQKYASLESAPVVELEKLNYLTAVIQEGLRLYPPAPFLLRRRMEKGSFVFIPVWAMHRNDRQWDDPTAFKPERWLKDGKLLSHPSFLPFGAGPRVCIGKRFAMTEARVFLAELVHHYRIRYSGTRPPKMVATVLTRPKKPLLVALERREE